jgi:2-methylisocitrate lyase-like PEP mutase family enzyme
MEARFARHAVAGRVRVLRVPLSVDIENGYADDAKTVGETVRRLVDAGIAGINIEDGSDAPATLAAKIEAIKNAAAKAGSDIFVNARTDVSWRAWSTRRNGAGKRCRAARRIARPVPTACSCRVCAI